MDYILFKLQQMQKVDESTLQQLAARFDELDENGNSVLCIGEEIPSAQQVEELRECIKGTPVGLHDAWKIMKKGLKSAPLSRKPTAARKKSQREPSLDRVVSEDDNTPPSGNSPKNRDSNGSELTHSLGTLSSDIQSFNRAPSPTPSMVSELRRSPERDISRIARSNSAPSLEMAPSGRKKPSPRLQRPTPGHQSPPSEDI